MSTATGTYMGISVSDYEDLYGCGVQEVVDILDAVTKTKVEFEGEEFYLLSWASTDQFNDLMFQCEINGFDFFYTMFDYIKSTHSVKPV